MKVRNTYNEEVDVPVVKVIVLSVVAIALAIALCVGGAAGCKEYGRYQKRADAKNRTQIVKQEIKTAGQQAKVNRAQIAATQAEAEKRIVEARGIRSAQDLIAKTLTPLYISHEAIQAQKAMATQGQNNTSIYIPSGANGVPLVNDVSDHRLTGGPQG